MTSPSLTETLANLSISWILTIVIVATVLRLGFVRVSSARPLVEILESFIIAVVLVYMIIRPFVVQAYFIPSPSMEPTLLGKNGSGDRILVNKFQYRFHKPQHDDVVVFIPPKEATEGGLEEESGGTPVNFIKRLIALPGDRIQAFSGKVIVNGAPFSHSVIRDKLATAGDLGPDAAVNPDTQADHHVKFTDQAVLVDGKPVSNSHLADILTGMPSAHVQIQPGYTVLNGKRLNEPFTAEDPDYDLKIYHGEPLKFDPSGYKLDGQMISKAEYDKDNAVPTGPIPAHHFFMMGDNRNDSKDSTEWGPLDERSVVGRAQFIFWPLNRIRAIH